ncbi:MAG: sulfite exporter TauE/SafE family protein [Verrucomicrobiales bacterium]|nr:sulfite exporter TauE/SafE family protein [Verrucomicrobiales bacterium]
MTFLAAIEFSPQAIAIAMLGAFCLGVAKTGFPGLAIVNVLIVAELFGAKESVGIILPLLIVCDLAVYPLFRRHASWRQVWPLLVPTLLGVLLGFFWLGRLDDQMARRTIGCIILAMLGLQLMREYRRSFLEHLPDSRFFRWLSGGTIGVATMLANAAGPVYSIYALVHRMAKEEFLGVGARFFLLVNVIKVPLLVDLALINARSLTLDAILLPGIAAGILLGRRLIRIVPQRVFEWLLYGFSLVAGLRLLLA